MQDEFNGKRLADLRNQHRYSQRELAAAAGVTSGFIAALEAGNSRNPGINDLTKVAKALGVEPVFFLEPVAQNIVQTIGPQEITKEAK